MLPCPIGTSNKPSKEKKLEEERLSRAFDRYLEEINLLVGKTVDMIDPAWS